MCQQPFVAEPLTQVDRYGGWIRMIGKGDKERIVRIAERALKSVRAYVRMRGRRKARRRCSRRTREPSAGITAGSRSSGG